MVSCWRRFGLIADEIGDRDEADSVPDEHGTKSGPLPPVSLFLLRNQGELVPATGSD